MNFLIRLSYGFGRIGSNPIRDDFLVATSILCQLVLLPRKLWIFVDIGVVPDMERVTVPIAASGRHTSRGHRQQLLLDFVEPSDSKTHRVDDLQELERYG